ncbi:hypothetical protein DFLDMN_003045 [Cupriavidus sp. H19C3]
MLRRAAIVSAFAAGLAMPLAGCGIRGPLTMPRVPPAPTAPNVPDPGLGNPNLPLTTVPPRAPESAPGAAPDGAAASPTRGGAEGASAMPADRAPDARPGAPVPTAR